MSSSHRTDTGSKPRQPIPAPAGSSDRRPRIAVPSPAPADDDILSTVAPPTDDTPTIISRNIPGSVPPLDPDLSVGIRGRRLAHFELIEPIGVGGMAAVLRARDTQLDRFVALKILPPEMAGDDENVRRFHQEARSAAKLDHENIARVFFCGEDQRLHFIAFEFVEGENLRTVMERRGRLPVGDALHYMIQVAAGLAHASARGVVHRDIKPSNIIITPSGRAKLVDMGLARTMERHSENDLTQSGVTLGTFDYISPEQALEPRDADVRSDLYSLGCTFYHALTGRPPVPEGTAAKKLHHHQNVKPVDPRQYVPDLPLEVVQLLDRMMAKKPRDRFQTPQELVHRLLLAARTLGVNADVPEGVLSLETTVPASPAGRPLIWAAIAAVAVVGLVLLLDPLSSFAPTPEGKVSRIKPETDAGPPLKDAPGVVKTVDPPVAVEPDPMPKEAVYVAPAEPSARHLLDWLAQRRDLAKIELQLAGELDLSAREGVAAQRLLVKAQEVIIKPKDRDARPTIRLSYDGQPSDKPRIALMLACKKSSIEGVRFLIDARYGCSMVALQLGAGGHHQVKGCTFVQTRATLDGDPVRSASLVVEGGRGDVAISDCAFLGFNPLKSDTDDRDEQILVAAAVGGQDAIVRRGRVRLSVDNCVFGPHTAAFRVEDEGGDDFPLVVKRCSILLPAHRSAAFDVPARATARLEVEHCLISRLDAPTPLKAEGVVLIRQAEESGKALSYHGRDNGYHDLDGYWAVGDDWRNAGWGDFRNRSQVQDASRLVLAQAWESNASQISESLDRQNLITAFQLNTRLLAVRELGRSKTESIGARSVLGERLINGDLPEVDPSAEPRLLIVEKNTDDSTNSVYPTLDLAVRSARAKDTILIRHDGDLAIDPVLLNKTALADLTIRPARRFRPVLELGESSETETALFRVQNGTLRLEGLAFLLKPPKKALTQLTLVALAGDGVCEVRGCTVTLEKPGDTTVALAALLPKPDKEMKLDMPPARKPDQGPRLLIDNCFIRGDGDLFLAKSSRPCELALKNSVAALAGTALAVELTTEGNPPLASHRMNFVISQSTAYLGSHLVRLSATKDVRAIVPIRCKATSSLFLAATPGRALVQLDGGAELEEKSLKDKFTWEGGQNGYGGYTSMMALVPGGDEMAPPAMKSDEWKTQPGEDGSVFSVKPSASLTAETRFTALTPALFRASKEAPKSGADVSATKFPQPGR